MIDVRFDSLTGKQLDLFVLFDPALSNDGDDDSGRSVRRARHADAQAASALAATPALHAHLERLPRPSDGWTDLRSDFRMDWAYARRANGNVVQTARRALDGVKRQHMTLVIGFGTDGREALSTARAALHTATAPPRATRRLARLPRRAQAARRLGGSLRRPTTSRR